MEETSEKSGKDPKPPEERESPTPSFAQITAQNVTEQPQKSPNSITPCDHNGWPMATRQLKIKRIDKIDFVNLKGEYEINLKKSEEITTREITFLKLEIRQAKVNSEQAIRIKIKNSQRIPAGNHVFDKNKTQTAAEEEPNWAQVRREQGKEVLMRAYSFKFIEQIK